MTVLTPANLIYAYQNGYFPMPSPETGEIVWLMPHHRAVIPLDQFHVSRSLKRTLKRGGYRVTFDQAFAEVMQGCSERAETWITEEFRDAYTQMYHLGIGHSVEVWLGEKLVGGVYGICIEGVFFAESKFHRARDASKVALYALVEHLKKKGFAFLEVQFMTPHLKSLGAIELSAETYLKELQKGLSVKATF